MYRMNTFLVRRVPVKMGHEQGHAVAFACPPYKQHFTYKASPNLHASDTSVLFEQSQQLQMCVGPRYFLVSQELQRWNSPTYETASAQGRPVSSTDAFSCRELGGRSQRSRAFTLATASHFRTPESRERPRTNEPTRGGEPAGRITHLHLPKSTFAVPDDSR